MSAPGSVLLVRCRSVVAALPVASAVETMRPLPAPPVAGQPPCVRGIAVIRGAPAPVLDLAVLLGGGPCAATRFVTIRAGGRLAALAVDEVLGLRRLGEVDDLPPLLRGANPAMVGLIATLDAQLLAVLDGMRVVPESAWAAAGEGGP